jgi:hypothetical protein
MPVHIVTGKLGSGKTLVTVGKIKDYLERGRKVATNLDLKLENLVNIRAKKTVCYRLPDIPTVDSFKGIKQGYDGPFQGDHANGLIVLDECALWLNSRAWNDKARKPLIDHFVHMRKLRWDVMIIIQDEEALDKQFRTLYAEHTVFCSRTDRHNVPFFSWFVRQAGFNLKLPKMHTGTVFYNVGHGKSTHTETWMYRGTGLMNAYNTEQSFDVNSPELYSYLPPYTLKGRYVSQKQQIKTWFKDLNFKHFFLLGLLSGAVVVNAIEPEYDNPEMGMFTCNAAWKELFSTCDITREDVTAMVKKFQSVETIAVSDSSDSAIVGVVSDVNPIDGIYITGSVGIGSNFEYAFAVDGNTFDPNEAGYRVYDITDCKAQLLNVSDNRDRKIVTCIKPDN